MTSTMQLDPRAFAAAYDRSPLAVTHDLGSHPLLRLDALAELAAEHPVDEVEHNVGALPVELPSGEAPQADLHPRDLVRGIEDNGCWMVIKRVERDPRYRALLDELLDPVDALLPAGHHVTGREAFVFVSAPGTVTPAHIDPEQNFLLQVRGRKQMHVGRFPSETVRTRELEQYYAGRHRNIGSRPTDETTFEMTPGDGVYVPLHAPHWVRNGDEVSVSFSITFFTDQVRREAALWGVNARLRDRGLRPRQPGQSVVGDRAKLAALRAGVAAKRALPGRRSARSAT